jgi:diaminopimelate decarboxylase
MHEPPLTKEQTPRPRRPRFDPEAAAFDALISDILCHLDAPATPLRIFLPSVCRLHLARIERALSTTITGQLSIDAAYSVKTNPDPRILAAAHEHGLIAETISQLEVEHALEAGFSASEIVLNGPAKWWPAPLACDTLRAVFCDSATELSQTVDGLRTDPDLAQAIGVRVRPADQRSRFGVPLFEPDVFDDVVGSLCRLDAGTDIGLHFHLSPYLTGVDRWWRLLSEVIDRAQALERATAKPISCLDLGGGWRPADFLGYFLPTLSTVFAPARRPLMGLKHLLVEPGRAVAEPLAALMTTVLEVRRGSGHCEVVVDASIAEVPEISVHHHQWLGCPRGGLPETLGPGGSTILGRSCVEADILASGIEIPGTVRAGDVFVITDVGAYDTSKSYPFGRGCVGNPPTQVRV